MRKCHTETANAESRERQLGRKFLRVRTKLRRVFVDCISRNRFPGSSFPAEFRPWSSVCGRVGCGGPCSGGEVELDGLPATKSLTQDAIGS